MAAVESLTWTPAEAAAAIGVSPRTVSRMVARGDIPALHVGRRTLIVRTALAEWVANNADTTIAGRDQAS